MQLCNSQKERFLKLWAPELMYSCQNGHHERFAVLARIAQLEKVYLIKYSTHTSASGFAGKKSQSTWKTFRIWQWHHKSLTSLVLRSGIGGFEKSPCHWGNSREQNPAVCLQPSRNGKPLPCRFLWTSGFVVEVGLSAASPWGNRQSQRNWTSQLQPSSAQMVCTICAKNFWIVL